MPFHHRLCGLVAAPCLLSPVPIDSLRVPPPQERAEAEPEGFPQQGPERSALFPSDWRLGPYETKASWTTKHGKEEEFMSTYQALADSLAGVEGLSHSAHILEYVMGTPGAPVLSRAGCLYLPHNSAWRQFYDSIHHPDPRLFSELVAASFFPDCGRESLHSSAIQACGGEVKRQGSEMRIQGTSRCIEAEHVSYSSNNITIMASDGMVGMPERWRYHFDQVQRMLRMPLKDRVDLSRDRCRQSALTPVPSGHQLIIPARYVICMSSDDRQGVDEDMIRAQNEWSNDDLAGKAKWGRLPEEQLSDNPQQVDMNIQFKFVGVTFVHDKRCSKDGFYDPAAVEKHINNSDEEVTIILIGDDASGILGMSPLPMEFNRDEDVVSVVLVSQQGLRGFSSKKGDEDLSYDEGDTVTHEAGHFFGLYHTFQDGCSKTGDLVEDTEPEEMPRYICGRKRSCDGSADPIHNFMDYTPDACMTGFTEQQKRRAWCAMEKYRPKLYKNSLQAKGNQPEKPSGKPAGKPAGKPGKQLVF